jgi:hypothetical protein
MAIQVLIESLSNKRFRATSGGPLAESVVAPTREEALARLRERLQARLKNGAELVPLEMAPQPHPWMEFAGMYDPDDPVVQAWERAVAEYRRKINEHPERP